MDMDMKKLMVQDLMQTDVKMVSKNTTLLAAAKMMHDLGVSSLIVEPYDDRDAFGIITRKDIIETLVTDTIGGIEDLVENIMSKPAITVNIGLSIYSCQQLMRMVGVRRLPVLDGTDLVGILSNTDIFAKLVEGLS
ncbi:CBS domain-containing protein [bacterium]|nr:CBS domain-containing protein [bacterium]